MKFFNFIKRRNKKNNDNNNLMAVAAAVDPKGSYTGNPLGGGKPVQDADDL